MKGDILRYTAAIFGGIEGFRHFYQRRIPARALKNIFYRARFYVMAKVVKIGQVRALKSHYLLAPVVKHNDHALFFKLLKYRSHRAAAYPEFFAYRLLGQLLPRLEPACDYIGAYLAYYSLRCRTSQPGCAFYAVHCILAFIYGFFNI